ncbi:PP2C family protein-serine/threonine phosphatase [Cellulomonas shaoxiangyii]|uniref:Serine/threonine-protein phosphatase n=1 Tax=Cellulomonas shaoxiangyii TaxID=2566013 RepID=A0A4P7SL77_9CELL|nr:protein phosphatase 2C domain-containing protein [Cellulomonas shaoxiangyii]QCB94247.1 serine/threonine-protein phosphatase [Cellulomonas shaoxiangyii]
MTGRHEVGGVVLVTAAATETGRLAAGNADACRVAPPVFVVADGTGADATGAAASAAVVAAFTAEVPAGAPATLDQVRRALERAHVEVGALARDTGGRTGSTVTGAVLTLHEGRPHWLVLNVGDSRVYRLLRGELHLLTVDHTQAPDEARSERPGARRPGGRAALTRAVGAPDATADSWLLPVVDGERLLLCSAGLARNLADETVQAVLALSGAPATAASALVGHAARAGTGEDVTVVVVDVLSGGRSPGLDDTSRGTGTRTDTVDDDTRVVRR